MPDAPRLEIGGKNNGTGISNNVSGISKPK